MCLVMLLAVCRLACYNNICVCFLDDVMVDNTMMQMDPHSLSPSVMESVMQLELLAAEQEHVVEYKEPDRYLSEQSVSSVQVDFGRVPSFGRMSLKPPHLLLTSLPLVTDYRF